MPVPDFCDGRKGEDPSLYGRLAVWAKKSPGSKGGGDYWQVTLDNIDDTKRPRIIIFIPGSKLGDSRYSTVCSDVTEINK